MKKWWVGLLLMAVALVMIPATALAVKYEGQTITHYCSTCGADRECVLLQDITSFRHITDTQHQIIYRCLTCQTASRWSWEDHYGGSPTCMEPAECAGCGASYTLAHTWVAANCQTASYCIVCYAPHPDSSKDPNNHVGPMDAYDFVFSDDDNHTERQQCRACKAIVSVGTEAHVPSRSATCAEQAYCGKCESYYGAKDSTNHDWGAWTYYDDSQHYRECTRGCGSKEYKKHSGGTAACNAQAKCEDCKRAYGDLDASNHVGTLTDVDWLSIGDDNVHRVKQQCGACNGYVETKTEAHVPSFSATCVEQAFCDKCNDSYGTTDPDNHDWGAWTYADANTHSRKCNRCYVVEPASHSGGTATCVDKAECTDCHSAYGDVDEDNHASTLDISYVYRNDYVHEVTEACKSCGYSSSINEGHTSATPATCATAEECTLCRTLYKNPANHTDSVTQYARISDEQHSVTVACDGCGTIFSSTSEAHTWGDWTADGTTHTRTCQKPGCGAVDTGRHTSEPGATCVTAQACAICNVQYLDPDNHEGGRVTTYAIDPDDAYRHIATQTCGGCQAVLSAGSEGHTTDKTANCMHGAHCSVCDLYYGNTLSHRMGQWQPADDGQRHYRTCEYGCGETGYAAHDVTRTASCVAPASCRDCGVFGEVDADAHDWTEWTLWDNDQHWRYCRNNVSEHVEYAAHTGGTATCETRAMCDVCEEYYGQRLGHDYVEHEGKEPTCTEGGWYDYVTCSRCDYNGYVEKPALGHDLVLHNPKAATCTEGGWDVYETCSRCDYTVYVPTAALGHDIVTHEGRAASCTETGWDAYETCARCDYTTYAEIAALGHDIVAHEGRAATCTEIGWDAYETCARCDYTTYAEIAALGHDMVLHNPKAATCTEGGWDVYETCSRCDYYVYVPTAALGHDYAAATTKPTCTTKGYTTHTCTRCQDSYRDGVVAARGHWYGEWTPNADGTHTAVCLRGCGNERTTACTSFTAELWAGDARTELDRCPVCGEVSAIRLYDADGELTETLDGVRLLLVEDATAEALTEKLPAGELVVRMEALPNGETLMSVAFELGGLPTQPTGQVRITLPAGLLEGYALQLIAGDGTETALPVGIDEEAETACFVLDFTDSDTPVQLMHVVPVE